MTAEALEQHLVFYEVPRFDQTVLSADGQLATTPAYPFGIEASVFFGTNPNGSPQDARLSAKVFIENMPHWEKAITLTRANVKEWNAAVKQNPAIQDWPGLETMDIDEVAKALASVNFPPGLIDKIIEHKGDSRPCDTN